MSGYKEHAYERTIIQALQRVMLDRFIASDTSPKETLVCETVFRSESDVPQDALMQVFNKLQLWENDQHSRMKEFNWQKDEAPLPFLASDQPPPEAKKTNGTRKERRRQRKDRKPGGEGGGTGT